MKEKIEIQRNDSAKALTFVFQKKIDNEYIWAVKFELLGDDTFNIVVNPELRITPAAKIFLEICQDQLANINAVQLAFTEEEGNA